MSSVVESTATSALGGNLGEIAQLPWASFSSSRNWGEKTKTKTKNVPPKTPKPKETQRLF